MKNQKLVGFLMVCTAIVASMGLLVAIDLLNASDNAGMLQSGMLSGSNLLGVTTAITAIFWLLLIGGYWGFLSGDVPTDRDAIYAKGLGTMLVVLGSIIINTAFLLWAWSKNITIHGITGSLSLGMASWGIVCLILVEIAGIGMPKIKAKPKKDMIRRIAVVVTAFILALVLETVFIVAGGGSLESARGNTILAPNLDFACWAIFWMIYSANIGYTKLATKSKVRALGISFGIAIVAGLLFTLIQLLSFGALKMGEVSAIFSCWSIFGLLVAIQTKGYE